MTSGVSDAKARITPRNDRRIYEKVAEKLIQGGNDVVVCGHYHHGIDMDIYGGKLIVLGNWLRSDTYAELRGGEIRLMRWLGDHGEPVADSH